MEFRIADTFTDSFARLTGNEQKSVKTTAFDLQIDPSAPGISFDKLDWAKDKNFWSVRVSSDTRPRWRYDQLALMGAGDRATWARAGRNSDSFCPSACSAACLVSYPSCLLVELQPPYSRKADQQ